MVWLFCRFFLTTSHFLPQLGRYHCLRMYACTIDLPDTQVSPPMQLCLCSAKERYPQAPEKGQPQSRAGLDSTSKPQCGRHRALQQRRLCKKDKGSTDGYEATHFITDCCCDTTHFITDCCCNTTHFITDCCCKAPHFITYCCCDTTHFITNRCCEATHFKTSV